jgi:hypothetical protein
MPLEPFAISHCLEPRNSDDGLFGVIEIRIIPERRRLPSSCMEKASILGIRHLACGQVEGIDPNSVYGTFIFLARIRAHPEPASRNKSQLRLRRRDISVWEYCS